MPAFLGVLILLVFTASFIGIIVGLIIGIALKRWQTLKYSSIACGIALAAIGLAIILNDSETTSPSTGSSSVAMATPIPQPTATPANVALPTATPVNVARATATPVVAQITATPDASPLTANQVRYFDALAEFQEKMYALSLSASFDETSERAVCIAVLEFGVAGIDPMNQSTHPSDKQVVATQEFADLQEQIVNAMINCTLMGILTPEDIDAFK